MTRSQLTSLRLSLLLLGLTAATASAQRPASVSVVNTIAVAQSDSASGRGNWLVALLKKISRRSDDSLTLAGDPPNADAIADAEGAGMATRRVFTSRKDSIAYESARTTAERAKGF